MCTREGGYFENNTGVRIKICHEGTHIISFLTRPHHGRNSVTGWPVVPVLQVTIVPVPICRVSSQSLRFLQRISSYHGKYLYLWCQICPWYWSNIKGTLITIKHHFELYNIDSSGDSFCAHLVTVLSVLRHDCARTTHPAVTVLPVLRVVLFDSI